MQLLCLNLVQQPSSFTENKFFKNILILSALLMYETDLFNIEGQIPNNIRTYKY